MFLRNGRIGIFDLAKKSMSEDELEEEATWEKLSSVDTADRLASEHGEDAIVLGTGVLTGSFVPAACAGIVRAKPDADGRRRVMPILGFAGFELKLSGFDFVVVKGVAEKPGYLWIRDGNIDFVLSDDMRLKDSWARTDRIRREQGDDKIQVIAGGPWCDMKHPNSQAVVDYWGGEDKAGVGAELGRKNLVAIAMRGMGELELAEPEGHFEDAILLMREQMERLGTSEGLSSYSDVAKRADFKALQHRIVACYGCPFPCRSYLKVEEDPKEFRLVAKEPGYLHFDIPALEKAFEVGLSARDATFALMKCAKAGAEPGAVLEWVRRSASKATLEGVDGVLMNPANDARGMIERAGENFERSFELKDHYWDCLGMGLCPRYWSKAGWDKVDIGSFAEDMFGKAVTRET